MDACGAALRGSVGGGAAYRVHEAVVCPAAQHVAGACAVRGWRSGGAHDGAVDQQPHVTARTSVCDSHVVPIAIVHDGVVTG